VGAESVLSRKGNVL